jgi:hypothetical protein
MGTAALVPLFLQFSDGVNFLSGGFGRELLDRLLAAGNPKPHGETLAVPIRAEILKRVYDRIVEESTAIFTFMSSVIGLEKNGDCVTAAVLAGKSGLFAVKAGVFLDCTGDGDLAAWAGAPFEKGDGNGHLMPGSLCSVWANIDWEKAGKQVWPTRRDQSAWIEQAYKDGVLSIEDRHLPGMFVIGSSLGCGNLVHAFGLDGTDERSLTDALVDTRRRILEYEQYYKKYLRGFENMELMSTGSLMGVRETRRVMGDYVLNIEDFKNRAVFEDEIGRFAYPVDIHPSVPSAETYAAFLEEFEKTLRYGRGESYGIPYRSLIPKGLSNVLVAGRCISSDRYIQGSVRVMPGCFITGQAAGMAAALAVEDKTDVRGVSVAELQRRLKRIGAFLPNCKEE